MASEDLVKLAFDTIPGVCKTGSLVRLLGVSRSISTVHSRYLIGRAAHIGRDGVAAKYFLAKFYMKQTGKILTASNHIEQPGAAMMQKVP